MQQTTCQECQELKDVKEILIIKEINGTSKAYCANCKPEIAQFIAVLYDNPKLHLNKPAVKQKT